MGGHRATRYAITKLEEVEEAVKLNSEQREYLEKSFALFQEKMSKSREGYETKLEKMETEIISNKIWSDETNGKLEHIGADLMKLEEIDALKKELTRLTSERINQEISMPNNIKALMEKEKETWTDDIFQLKEKFEVLRTRSMELVSHNLNHEREIREMRKKIEELATNGGGTECRCPHTIVPCKFTGNAVTHEPTETTETAVSGSSSSHELDVNEDDISVADEKSNYELKCSKLNQAVDKLKDDMRYAAIKNQVTGI